MSFESKFVAPVHVGPRLAVRLGQVLARDPAHPLDRVHSVYFDSWDGRAAAEVRDGDFYKTKLRVRWYASSGAGRAWLERKQKIGARRVKSRRPLDGFDPRAPLGDPRWRRLAAQLAAGDAGSFIGVVEPVLHLAYRRRRFVHRPSGLRVALDDDIRLLGVHPRIAAAAPLRDVALRELVLEVKGDSRELPRELAFVRDLGLRRRAFSKYGACRGAA